jgi:hypothetical protein
MRTDLKETTMARPKLYVPLGAPFIVVLKRAMQTARSAGMNEFEMITDIQSVSSISDKKEKLAKYFDIV